MNANHYYLSLIRFQLRIPRTLYHYINLFTSILLLYIEITGLSNLLRLADTTKDTGLSIGLYLLIPCLFVFVLVELSYYLEACYHYYLQPSLHIKRIAPRTWCLDLLFRSFTTLRTFEERSLLHQESLVTKKMKSIYLNAIFENGAEVSLEMRIAAHSYVGNLFEELLHTYHYDDKTLHTLAPRLYDSCLLIHTPNISLELTEAFSKLSGRLPVKTITYTTTTEQELVNSLILLESHLSN